MNGETRGRRPRAAIAAPRVELRAEATFARHLLKQRRKREELLGKAIFADPAWDMFLDLFASEVEGKRVAMSSLVIAAAVPQSTALRWMSDLTRNGSLEQHKDQSDGRRTFIRLSETTFDLLASLLASWMSEARAALVT